MMGERQRKGHGHGLAWREMFAFGHFQSVVSLRPPLLVYCGFSRFYILCFTSAPRISNSPPQSCPSGTAVPSPPFCLVSVARSCPIWSPRCSVLAANLSTPHSRPNVRRGTKKFTILYTNSPLYTKNLSRIRTALRSCQHSPRLSCLRDYIHKFT